ncbi:MAG TPA: preprotein translocase subunit SecG [Polymorphobacter sp.]|nr:preprotein translocase subunit SecG [Polymorphobacter sp.]
MLTTFILVVHALIALALVAVILLQRSEGGALGIGGSGGGLMSARGAADLLTRATAILGTLFIVTSILLAVLAAGMHRGRDIDTSLAKPVTAPVNGPGGISIVPPAATPAPVSGAPVAPATDAPAITPIDQVPVAK